MSNRCEWKKQNVVFLIQERAAAGCLVPELFFEHPLDAAGGVAGVRPHLRQRFAAVRRDGTKTP